MSKRILTLIITLTFLFIMPNATRGQAHKGKDFWKFRRVEKAIPNHYIVVFKDSVSRLRIAGEARALATAYGAS